MLQNHSEIFTVLEGRVEVTLNGVKKLFRAGDQDLLIPARAVHSVRGFEGERLVMRERSDPPGDYKALFFNDLLSTGSFDSFSHFLRASYDGDAYIALPLYFRFLDVVFMTVAGGIAHLFAPRKVEAL
ncbi:hypothetical protein BJ170DRAFT_614683 [Xylariales sp. AK1849]|nr:hypothetical protein BJ170DRAFT_614683 [Xylariales sp. AK1849]